MSTQNKNNTMIFMLRHIQSRRLLYGISAAIMCSYNLILSILEGQLYAMIVNISNNFRINILKALFFLALIMIMIIICAVCAIFFYDISLTTDKKIRVKIISKLFHAPLRVWSQKHEAQWLTILGKDLTDASKAYKEQMIVLVEHIISIIGGFWVVGSRSFVLATTAFLLGIIYFGIGMLRSRVIRMYSSQQLNLFGEATTHMQNLFEGNLLLKFYKLGDFIKKKCCKAIENMFHFGVKVSAIQALNFALGQLGYMLAYTGTFLAGLLLVNNKSLTIQNMLALWPVAIGIAYSVQKIGFYYTVYQKTAAAINRIQEIDKLSQEDYVSGHDLRKDELVTTTQALRFEHVNFSYDGIQQALTDISFVVNNGEKVCLVGESGSGKSTIIRLIMRFYELDQGEIYLYEKLLSWYTLISLRSQLAYIPQNPKLFSVSIHENIHIGDVNEKDDKVEQSIKKALANNIIDNLPQGTNSIIGVEGLSLSGGQQQRIAIARAYMRDGAIMLCDEVAAALDNESECAIMDTLLESSRTVIYITHHLESAKKADKIIALRSGRIVEIGSHAELYNRKGYYYSLWNLR